MKAVKENTKDYILRTVAPIFNKKGYVATSLSDLEKATSMTKGAIYRNFKSKEDLAVQAFKYNIKLVLAPLSILLSEEKSATKRLQILTDYYRNYLDKTDNLGGCPLINIGIDTHFTNPELFRMAQKAGTNLRGDLRKILEDGIAQDEFRESIEVEIVAQNLFSMIEGSIFVATLHESNDYVTSMMDHIDYLVQYDFKK
ncbi:TetR/AcrR family transcriptional regulator [Sediminitomix flava]|uniref:TetR family transcriptional regulator n=1 Tax=Sediminitomix flava TaxID=379075 RepID=A0A315ZFW1_SEDFL|nr:TetR/AcrR family transcriptional regulator [Sediminitomix flava]PWJ44043.1 TetR family transcriptional regulator [Sediminitomix flava]